MMDYRNLSEDVLTVVVNMLQYYDWMATNPRPQSFAAYMEATTGGIERYRRDPLFRVKVQSLTSQLMVVIEKNISTSSNENQHDTNHSHQRPAECAGQDSQLHPGSD